ncbi:MAG: leucine-rich repeat domain-containing protein [Clostridia bacterium]|nr:leucine-rich repeat domain-containing protein [Clostridia bacterium]
MKHLSLCLILVLLCAVASTCVPASAESESFTILNSQKGTLSTYNGEGGEVTVPGEIDGVQAKIVSASTFDGHADITGLSFSEGIQTIDSFATYNMAGLTHAELGPTVAVLAMHNFELCPSLTELTIPASVRFIGRSSISECASLKNITFEGRVPVIEEYCFSNLSENVVFHVPNDQLEAYTEALPEGVDIVTTGKAAADYAILSTEDDFDIDGAGVITGYHGLSPIIDIPAQINGIAVTGIGQDVFARQYDFFFVTFPDGIKSIGDRAFYSVRAQEFYLPDSVEKIGIGAFGYNTLSMAHWPECLVSIGDEAFQSCTFQGDIALPESLQSIGARAFKDSHGFSSVVFPATIERIGDEAFSGSASLEYLIFNSSKLPEISASAFEGVTLLDVDLPSDATKEEAQSAKALFESYGQDSVYVWRAQNPEVEYANFDDSTYDNGFFTGYHGTQSAIRPYDQTTDEDGVSQVTVGIGDGALKGNQIVTYFSVPYNDSFRAIGSEAFMNSIVERIDLFDSVEAISDRAFANCQSLTELTLPASLTFIADDALAGCTALNTVTVLCDPQVLPEGLFDTCTALHTVRRSENDSEADIRRFMFDLGLVDSPLEEKYVPYAGTWHGIWLDMGLIKGDPRTMWQTQILLELNDDMSAQMNFDEAEGNMTWSADSEGAYISTSVGTSVLSLDEDGLLTYVDTEGNTIIFSRDENQVYEKAQAVNDRIAAGETEEPASTEEPAYTPEVTIEPTVVPAPTAIPTPENSATNVPAPANPQAPATPVPTAPAVLMTDVVYECVRIEAKGHEYTPTDLGGACSVIFQADGNVTLIVAGTVDPSELTWSVDGWSGSMIVPYYGSELVFEPTENGCSLNYLDRMTLYYVIQDAE